MAKPDHSNTVALTIRLAEEGDAPAIADLMGELGYPTRSSDMQMRLQAMKKEPHYRTFVAITGGKICGMIGTCCLHSHEHNNRGGRILALGVSKTTRRKGVGRELIRAAETDFMERNIRRIALNTRFQREEAHRFYEQLGYTRNGYRFVKELEGSAD